MNANQTSRFKSLGRALRRMKGRLSDVPERVLGRMRPFEPHDFLRAQSSRLETLLPYVSWVQDKARTLFILDDGGVGIGWELSPVGHEMMTEVELERVTDLVAGLFSKVQDSCVSFQFIFDSTPEHDAPVPEYFNEPQTSAQKIQCYRIREIQDLSASPAHRVRLMKRRVFLTMRIESGRHPVSLAGHDASAVPAELAASLALFERLCAQVNSYADEIEYVLSHAGVSFQPWKQDALLAFLRETFGSEHTNLAALPARDDVPLASQVACGFTNFSPGAIGAGRDTWEVCSWADQPPLVYAGMLSHFLTIDVPCRAVVNIRPCLSVVDLDRMRALLRNAEDAFGEMQKEEVRETQEAIARGKVLSFVSMHLLIRNEGHDVQETREAGAARSVASAMRTATQIPWIVEKEAAPALFLLALPFGYSKAAAGFSGRERRVLSSQLGPYLPLFGTFQGTRSPTQYMVSRAGGLVTLDSRDSETSPHMAVLASSGGGKSFYMANAMVAFAASQKRSMIFAIDKKTSYRILAEVIGKDSGSQFVEPPKVYPNIFRGRFDEFRLPVIVGILRTAISLVSPGARLGAIEEMLLSESVRMAFAMTELDARTEYREGALRASAPGQVRVPRLSDILENLFPVATGMKIPLAVPETLRALLSPFVGNGPYAALFDAEVFDDFDPPTPGFSLYDLDALSGNAVLQSLVTQCILAEILRQIRRPENAGVAGMLVIEEVGVLAGESPELVAFVQDAWKRFRKMGITCVGLTNQVKDYLELAGPREIWAVSPNKVILRMLDQDLGLARAAFKEGRASLFSREHHFDVASSLRKVDGQYSDALWLGDETQGTFTYVPTGFDYWCAASKPIEVEVALALAVRTKSMFTAVSLLATHFPRGVRSDSGELRSLSEVEMSSLAERGRAA